MLRRSIAKRTAGTIAAMLSLLLAACLLSPGKFSSHLDIRRDGRFSFAYSGEIYLLGLSKLAELGATNADTFTPEDCFRPGTRTKRPCAADELAEQRRHWQESQTEGADKRKRDAEAMKLMLGGIDPTSPKAAEEFAARLRRQQGWRRVDYKGEGLFVVDFAISGTLDRDFSFPSIERFPTANDFIAINRRRDGTLRVDAPGYAANGTDSLRGLMDMAAAGKEGANVPRLPSIDGAFSLTTDAIILANNTDQGPETDAAGQRLDWTITPRSSVPPTALLRLDR